MVKLMGSSSYREADKRLPSLGLLSSYTTGRLPMSVQEYLAAQINHFLERIRGVGSVTVENDLSAPAPDAGDFKPPIGALGNVDVLTNDTQEPHGRLTPVRSAEPRARAGVLGPFNAGHLCPQNTNNDVSQQGPHALNDNHNG